MQGEIEVKVNGKVIKRLVEAVDGTLEQMEETVDALSRRVAGQTLQASVNAVEAPRPLFRRTADGCVTRGTNREPSSD